MKNYKEILKEINTFIFDVDGVFTNSIVYLMPGGAQVRTANVRDGYAVQLAIKKGYRIAIITGGSSPEVKQRFEALGVQDVFLASSNKVEVYEKYVRENRLKKENICYVGDDIPDWKVMHLVGLPACPADAAPEIKSFCNYISPKNGGEGCVRDVIEQTLRAQNKWFDQDAHEW